MSPAVNDTPFNPERQRAIDHLQRPVVQEFHRDGRPKGVPLMEWIRQRCPAGARPNKPLKIRLLSGTHSDEDVYTGRDRTWVFDDPANNVIETFKRLDLSHNSPGYPPKYELIDGGPNSVTSPYEALPGETKEQYSKRLTEMVAKQLELFDATGAYDGTVLSASSADSPPVNQTQPNRQTTTSPGKPVDQMNDGELRQLAQAEGVDLKGFKGTRDALLRHVKAELKI